jgi:Protein of unknown function (DUF3192)
MRSSSSWSPERRRRGAAAALLGLLLAACAAPDRFTDRRQLIATFAMGTSREAVVKRLGPPDDEVSFRASHGREWQFLLYQTHADATPGALDEAVFTPLCFVSGRLVSWSWSRFHEAEMRGFPREDR